MCVVKIKSKFRLINTVRAICYLIFLRVLFILLKRIPPVFCWEIVKLRKHWTNQRFILSRKPQEENNCNPSFTLYNIYSLLHILTGSVSWNRPILETGLLGRFAPIFYFICKYFFFEIKYMGVLLVNK